MKNYFNTQNGYTPLGQTIVYESKIKEHDEYGEGRMLFSIIFNDITRDIVGEMDFWASEDCDVEDLLLEEYSNGRYEPIAPSKGEALKTWAEADMERVLKEQSEYAANEGPYGRNQ